MEDATSRTRLVLFAALSLGLSVLAGPSCTCSNGADTPSSAEKRLEAIAETLPAEAQALSVITDVDSFRQNLSAIDDTFGDVAPVADTLVRPLEEQLGVDPRKSKDLQKAGIATDGAFGLASVESHPVFYTFVTDRKPFEKGLRNQLEQARGLSSAPHSETVGDSTVKLLGEDRETVGWSYRGPLAMVVLPPLGEKTGAATTETVLEQLLDDSAETSLLDDEGFEHFRRAADSPKTFAYFDPSFLESRSLEGSADRATDAVEEALDGIGLMLSSTDSGARARVWTGFRPEAADRLGKLHGGAPAATWTRLATRQTLLGARVSVDWERAWKALKNLAPEGPRRRLQRRVDRLADPLDFDLEEDVLTELNGQMAAFFYGVGPNFTIASLSRRPGRAPGQMGMIGSVEFESAEALNNIVEAIADAGGSHVELQSPDGSSDLRLMEVTSDDARQGGGETTTGDSPPALIQWLETAPLRVAAAGRRLVVSTTAIGESSLVGYIEGTRDEAESLKASPQLDLGETFATGEQISGVYLNVTRAKANLSNKIPPLPTVQKVLSTVEEALVSIRPANRGQFIEFSIDAVPEQSSKEGAPDGAKDE